VTALAYLLWLVPAPVRVVAVAAMLAALIMMARRPSVPAGLVCAVPHTAAHVSVMALAVAIADALAAGGSASVWWRGLALLVAGAAVAPVVIGLYFVVAGTVAGVNDNEAFAAIRVREHKSFLRLHLDDHGRMRLFAIGIDDPPPRSSWRLDTAGAPDAPWFAPVDACAPRARLLDGPIDLGGS
jgi:hypothetical protein